MEIIKTLLNRLGDQDLAAFSAAHPNWALVQVERQAAAGPGDATDVTHKLDVQEIRRQAGGAGESTVWSLPISGSLRIGRSRDCDVLLTEGGVSKEHALLAWEGEQLFLTDLESTNGSYVNRRKLKPGGKVPVRGDDQIRFGYGETFQLMSPAGLFRYLEVLRRFGV